MRRVRCERCGEFFIPGSEHAMKDSRGFYCKPTCYIHRNDYILDRTGQQGRRKKVEQYTLAGKLVKVYECTAQAGEAVGRSNSAIAIACRNGTKCAKFKWKYADERGGANG